MHPSVSAEAGFWAVVALNELADHAAFAFGSPYAPSQDEAPLLQGAVLIWPVNRAAMRCPCWIVARMASDLRLLPADEPAERLLAMGWSQIQFAAHHGYAVSLLRQALAAAGLLPAGPLLGPEPPPAGDTGTLAGIAIGILVFGVFTAAMAAAGLASTL